MAIWTRLHSKPSYPQKIHPAQRSLLNFPMGGSNKGMKYSKHARIPERLRLWSCFWGFNHDIRVCPWIYDIPIASDIICRIVETHCPTLIEAFSSDPNCISIFIRELAIGIAFIISSEQMSENVIFKFRNEGLRWFRELETVMQSSYKRLNIW